jgi:hypothetical protein
MPSEKKEKTMSISRNKCLATMVVAGFLWTGAALARPADNLIVHEWGTFLSVQGSDGVTQGGMVDSEENLPWFVRTRSLGGRNSGELFIKMETPVTYFYVDKPRKVQVKVGMTRGLLTHWFPAVLGFGPAPSAKNPGPDSYLDWGS